MTGLIVPSYKTVSYITRIYANINYELQELFIEIYEAFTCGAV